MDEADGDALMRMAVRLAPYRETQKPLRNQRSRWSPVAPSAPNDLSKKSGDWSANTKPISITYKFRTKSA